MLAYHLELVVSAVALPGHMVRRVKGVGACLPGASGGKTWRIDVGNHDQRCTVFSPMDCDSGRMAPCPPSGRIRGRRGRPAVS